MTFQVQEDNMKKALHDIFGVPIYCGIPSESITCYVYVNVASYELISNYQQVKIVGTASYYDVSGQSTAGFLLYNMRLNGGKYADKLKMLEPLETVLGTDTFGNKETQIEFVWWEDFKYIATNKIIKKIEVTNIKES